MSGQKFFKLPCELMIEEVLPMQGREHRVTNIQAKFLEHQHHPVHLKM